MISSHIKKEGLDIISMPNPSLVRILCNRIKIIY